ncbi:hypothetical protein [Kribbella sp. C-35]|uniref:hypothetical protein n=1 Tax=Kribbella sp. C-35 TaxID=2789276 RepID=UPI00397AFC9A
MNWRLVPDNGTLAVLYRRAEDLLQGLSRAERAGERVLPAVLTQGNALSALLRTGAVLRDAVDAFGVPPAEPGRSIRPRLFAEGRERMPLRVVWISEADTETLAAALRALNIALTPLDRAAVDDPAQRRLLDALAELLDEFDPDTELWTGARRPLDRKELLQPLARLVALLAWPGDDDTTVLLAVRQANPDVDLELTDDQTAAYDRVVERINALLTAGDVHDILF